MKRHVIPAILAWLAVSTIFLVVYVRQEGWVMRPAPTHYWWWALSGWFSGFGSRPIFDALVARRRAKMLERAMQSLRDAAPLPSPEQRLWLDVVARQDEEWRAIRDEMLAAKPNEPVTAFQVTLEQRKRLLARGERLLTADDQPSE